MLCLKVDIPEALCAIDDELKAIYHSKDTLCIWVFDSRAARNAFMDETVGLSKAERQTHFDAQYSMDGTDSTAR